VPRAVSAPPEALSMPDKILIVDDEPSIIVALQFLMEQNGFETLVAFSGEEAMEIISQHRPALVLLDIMLPVVDGFEVCQRIRENPEWKEIRIVLVTALGSDANVTKGLDLGADAYVTKPFSNADLVAKVKELLECRG
jgi:DNA-binding response OmpR family regulator